MSTRARNKTEMQIVEPDLSEMERVISETSAQSAAMIQRTGSTRQKFETELLALEAEREAVVARQELARRHFESLMAGFAAELADIDGAIGFYSAGLSQDTLRRGGE